MTHYFDIHSHLDLYEPDERDQVLARMEENDVMTTTIGTNPESSKRAVELAEANERVYAAVGMHPEDAREYDYDKNAFQELARYEKVVAVGECGFDYSRGNRDDLRPHQKEVFESQIKLARETGKPLMLHVRPGEDGRDAYDDTLDILERDIGERGPGLTGNAHFFAGHMDNLERFVELGFTISFTGVITFTDDYNERVRAVPQHLLHAETDAPFVAPEPHRGTKNEPSNVRYVIDQMCQIRNEDTEVLREKLAQNARRLFRITS
jgi:TatD DNase family protein